MFGLKIAECSLENIIVVVEGSNSEENGSSYHRELGDIVKNLYEVAFPFYG